MIAIGPPVRPHAVRLLQVTPAVGSRNPGTVASARCPAALRWVDRALFIWLYRRCPRILNAITIVGPETVVRWNRKGFAAYWRWRSRSPGGRPRITKEVCDLIRRMSLEAAVGRPQDPWRAAQARHRGRPVHGFDLSGRARR